MACTKGLFGRVFFVCWENPSIEDVHGIVMDVARARVASGRKLLYIAVAPEDSSLPEPAVRNAMTTGMNATLEHCDEMFLIMEGSGFKNSIMRSIMAAIFLAGGKRDRVSVHRSIGTVLNAVDTNTRNLLVPAIALARANGVLRSEPVSGVVKSRATGAEPRRRSTG